MIEAFKLVGKIALEGGEKVQKGLAGVEKKLDNASSKFKNAGDKTAGFAKKLAPASAVATGAGVALFALAKEAGNYADAILDASDITGMSTQSIQEWEHVTKIAGISSDSFTKTSKQLTKQMSQLEAGTGRGADALKDLGIDFKDLESATPDERLDMVTTALAGIDDPAKRAQIGTDLLKRSYDDIAPALGLGAEGMAEARGEAHELGSVMDKDALVSANNFRIMMEKLTTRFQNTGREIALKFMPIFEEHFVPIIEKVIDKVGALADWIAGLNPNIIKWAIGIGALIAVLAPAIGVIAVLLLTIGQAISVIRTITTVMKLLNLTFLASPITWIILGVMALIAIGILLYKNWDTVVNWLSGAWQTIKTKATEIFGFVAQWVKDKFNEAKTALTNKVNEMKQNAINKFNEIKKGITDKINEIKNNIINRFEEAKRKAGEKFEALKTAITSPITKAKETISGIIEDIKGFFTGMKLSIPSIKLPKLPKPKITGSFSLTPPRVPSIRWNATGGFFDNSTLFGAGEAGREVLIPLQNRRYMKPFSDAISENLRATGSTDATATAQKIEIPINLNGREIARVMSRDIDRELERRRTTTKRGGRT